MELDIVCYLHAAAQLAEQLVADRRLPGCSNEKWRLFAADLQADVMLTHLNFQQNVLVSLQTLC